MSSSKETSATRTVGPKYPYETIMELSGTQLGLPPSIKERVEFVKKFAAPSKSESHSWRGGAPRPARGPMRPRDEVPGMSGMPGARPSLLKSSADATVLEKIVEMVRQKINKLDPSTYNDIRNWLYENFDPNDPSVIQEILGLIFEKATREETFCTLYAQLLHDLSDKYVLFRSLLLERTRKFLLILEESHGEADVKDAVDNEEFVRIVRERKYRRGYARFIGELFNYSLIGAPELETMLRSLVDTLMKVVFADSVSSEEYVHCIQRIFQGSHNKLADLEGTVTQVNRMQELMVYYRRAKSDYPGFTDKAFFAMQNFMDAYEDHMRDSETRRALVESVQQIVDGFGSAASRTALDNAVMEIMDYVGESSPEFKESVKDFLAKLQTIVKRPAAETPGLTAKARATLASMFRGAA